MYRYWGKAARLSESGPRYHLLPFHCLDVAAVGQTILERHPGLNRRLLSLFHLPEPVFFSWITFFLALHDLGKFSEAFQNLRPDLFTELHGRQSERGYPVRHDALGWLLWRKHLRQRVWLEKHLISDCGIDNDLEWGDVWEFWARAATGHHGEPPRETASGHPLALRSHFSDAELEAAETFVREAAQLFLPAKFPPSVDLQTIRPGNKIGSWLLAGFIVLCDWLGSNRDYFSYCDQPMPLEDYWRSHALPAARRAVEDSGVLPVAVDTRIGIRRLFPFIDRATSQQRLVESTPLGEGPQLFILEDLTGSGKTEAALTLAHRMMAGGLADGVFIALPTMATANAMYARVAEGYRRLYGRNGAPSLVLSHSARRLSASFRASILLPGVAPDTREYGSGEDSASATCVSWLADSRKKALLADVGVGTIDQALLAVLPSRHQSLRLLGLCRKVLIVDEVHSYDSYMNSLLQNLLRFQGALGGSAILLSATLPISLRRDLIDAFQGAPTADRAEGNDPPYPLLTQAGLASAREIPIDHADPVPRKVAVAFLRRPERVEAEILSALKQGRCVCWVRNTVADATEAFGRFRARLSEDRLGLFHARFAMSDRLAIEQRVVNQFGKDSKLEHRQGRLLIATQVVEQSLDLDFDLMVTDLAPIDLLIQRAGRLHRHARGDRGRATLIVYSPPLDGDPGEDWYSAMFPGAAWVYPVHGELWPTAKLLYARGGWEMPRDARDLIESVYGEARSEVPPALSQRDARAEAARKSASALARINSLSLVAGYKATPGQWLDDRVAPTRLGELQTTVRLARWDGKALAPWHADGDFPWEMSEVSVRHFWIAGEGESNDPALRQAIGQAKASMPDRGKWSVLVPLTVSVNDDWLGNAVNGSGLPVSVSYSKKTGLTITSNGGDHAIQLDP